MKKILIFLVFCVISITLFISCEKEVIPLVVEKPTAKLSITPEGVIPYGAKCTVAWESFNSPYCTLNGQPVKSSDSAIVQLFGDTTFTFKAINGNLSNSDEKSVKVGDWTTSNLGLLTYKESWMLKSMKVWQDSKMVADFILDEEQLTNLRNYYLSGTLNGIKYDYAKDGLGVYEARHKDGTLYGSSTFTFSEKKGEIYLDRSQLITKLTKNELIIDQEVLYNGKPSIFEETYYRP